jgi:hypothetical protein
MCWETGQHGSRLFNKIYYILYKIPYRHATIHSYLVLDANIKTGIRCVFYILRTADVFLCRALTSEWRRQSDAVGCQKRHCRLGPGSYTDTSLHVGFGSSVVYGHTYSNRHRLPETRPCSIHKRLREVVDVYYCLHTEYILLFDKSNDTATWTARIIRVIRVNVFV